MDKLQFASKIVSDVRRDLQNKRNRAVDTERFRQDMNKLESVHRGLMSGEEEYENYIQDLMEVAHSLKHQIPRRAFSEPSRALMQAAHLVEDYDYTGSKYQKARRRKHMLGYASNPWSMAMGNLRKMAKRKKPMKSVSIRKMDPVAMAERAKKIGGGNRKGIRMR